MGTRIPAEDGAATRPAKPRAQGNGGDGSGVEPALCRFGLQDLNIAASTKFSAHVLRPCVHELAALFQLVTAPLSCLYLILDGMGQSLLYRLAREGRPL